jgi:predicted nucleotidyltransferase
MNTDYAFQPLLNEIYNEIKNIYGYDLYKVILFGSYARNDKNNESDIDFLVLTNTDEEKLKKYNDILDDTVNRLSVENGVPISILVKSSEHFNRWKESMPLYKNVLSEGVEISA